MWRAAGVVFLTAGLMLWTNASPADSIGDDVALTEVAAYIQARPAFDRHCFRCHTGQSGSKKALGRLDMSRYPFEGKVAAVAGRAIRKVLGGPGGKATMPQDDLGAVSGDELATIQRWAEVFDDLHP